MADQNHMKNAGENVAKGVRSTLNNTAEGRFGDAAESAWEGTVDTTREIGKSVSETAGKVVDAVQNAVGIATSRTQDATEDAAEGRPADAIQSALNPNKK